MLWNNLGVVAYLEGHESQAIEYFKEAVQLDGYREAANNLGQIALKYRNGFEAELETELRRPQVSTFLSEQLI